MKKERKLYEVAEFRDLKELLNETVKKYRNRVAFKIKKENNKYKEITYAQVEEEVNTLGTALCNLGLKTRKIAIISNNRYEWAISYFAVANGTGIVVPLDKSLPEGEIVSSLKRGEIEAVIFEEKYKETMQKMMQDEESPIKYYINIDQRKEEGGILSYHQLQQKGKEQIEKGDTSFLNATIDPEKSNILLFTSGTTSASKIVMLSHKNIVTNIYALNSVVKIYPEDRNLAFLPLHHTFGSTALFFFMSNGTMTAFCDGLKYIQKNIQEYQISIFVCVPLLLEAMNKKIMKQVEKQGKTKIIAIATKVSNILLKIGIDIRKRIFRQILEQLGGNLRLIVSGAAGIDKNVARTFNNLGIRTIQGYGLTETSPVLTAENDKYLKYGSVGLPMINVQIEIKNPNEEGIGEIIAKGPNIMQGYYHNQEATKEILKNGWFYTGDLGYLDKDGYLFITGRKKNVIVMKNGKNIYPEELEMLIAGLPYVAESMVFGIPSKEDDLDLAVKIVYQQEYKQEIYPNITNQEFQEIVWKDIKKINKTMPPYKYIRQLILTDQPMIKTTTQKIKRYAEIEQIHKKS